MDKKEQQRQYRLETLKEAAGYALLKWNPKEEEGGLVTFCNLGSSYICVKMGFDGFRGMMANEMVSRMENHADFAVVDAKAAQDLANDGRLVIAGCKGDVLPSGHLDHGHVCVCYPGTLAYSKKWREDAPFCCNVGKTNGLMNTNWAFASKPKYYAWIQDSKEDA